MKPKTKLEKEIVKLSKKLPALSAANMKYIEKKINVNAAYRRKSGKTYCLECGKTFTLKDENKFIKCPHCGKKLEVINTKNKKLISNSVYFQIITTCNDYQVIRNFIVEIHKEINKSAKYIINEAVQNWIAPNGVVKIMARCRATYFSMYYDKWDFNTDIELRSGNYRTYNNPYLIDTDFLYPQIDVTNTIKRNGYNGNFYKIIPCNFFATLLKSNICETLLKTGQIELFKMAIDDKRIIKYWNCIKVAKRHKYHIENYRDWLDHIDLLKHFGKDIHNPYYICPKDFKSEKQKYIRKKNEEDRRRREEEQKRNNELRLQKEKEIAEKYIKEKSKYFEMLITDNIVFINVLKSVEEVMEEGNAMHHCVFTNRYYDKSDTLLLSAKDSEGNRLETIELSLKDYSIRQSRGKHNQYTEYHNQIIDLLNANMQVIRKLNRKVA